jgi:hypothetical protein
MAERNLETRERSAQPSLALGKPERCIRRLDGAREVSKPVLPELGNLHPGERPEQAPIRGEPEPGRFGVTEATQAPKEPAALREHSGLGPGCVAPARLRRVPGIADGVAPGPAAEVRGTPGRPPRFIVGARLANRETGSLGSEDRVFPGSAF